MSSSPIPAQYRRHGEPCTPPKREARNRVVRVRRFGGADGLEVADAPLPAAGRGEVRVRVLAASVQYTDVLIRRRLYPQTMLRRPPLVLGYASSGRSTRWVMACAACGSASAWPT